MLGETSPAAKRGSCGTRAAVRTRRTGTEVTVPRPERDGRARLVVSRPRCRTNPVQNTSVLLIAAGHGRTLDCTTGVTRRRRRVHAATDTRGEPMIDAAAAC